MCNVAYAVAHLLLLAVWKHKEATFLGSFWRLVHLHRYMIRGHVLGLLVLISHTDHWSHGRHAPNMAKDMD